VGNPSSIRGIRHRHFATASSHSTNPVGAVSERLRIGVLSLETLRSGAGAACVLCSGVSQTGGGWAGLAADGRMCLAVGRVVASSDKRTGSHGSLVAVHQSAIVLWLAVLGSPHTGWNGNCGPIWNLFAF